MGKKKGRQSGPYLTKSQKAVHLTELKDRASEVWGGERSSYRKHCSFLPVKDHGCVPQPQQAKRNGYSPSSLGSFTSSISVHRSSSGGVVSGRPKVTLGLAQLRGILQERQWEDRILDRDLRRRMHHDRVVGGAAVGGVMGSNSIEASSTPTSRHEVGWILSYGSSSGADETSGSATDGQRCCTDGIAVPTLQSLCIQSLAPVFPHYLTECGWEFVHSALATLPSTLLSDLSVQVCRIHPITDDGMAMALGMHNQIECLALHASSDYNTEEEEDDDDYHHNGGSEERGDGKKGLTDVTILSLVPKILSPSSVPESWEQIIDDDNNTNNTTNSTNALSLYHTLDVHIGGCPHLQKLELVDAHRNVTSSALISLFKGCPSITHLSLSGSLDDITGPELLLLLQHPNDHGTMLDLLPKLKVLDVGYCHWMTDPLLVSLLRTFLQERNKQKAEDHKNHEGNKKEKEALQPLVAKHHQHHPLQMISVTGCMGITNEICDALNIRLGGIPHVSSKVQTKKKV